MTSKLQISIPRALARRHGIGPGSELVFEDLGDALRLVPVVEQAVADPRDLEDRLRLFDEATARQEARDQARLAGLGGSTADRGWTRQELYDRALPR